MRTYKYIYGCEWVKIDNFCNLPHLVTQNLILQDTIVKNCKAYEKAEITRTTNADTAALMIENNQVCLLHSAYFKSCKEAFKKIMRMYHLTQNYCLA
jgi:hypothetical protein